MSREIRIRVRQGPVYVQKNTGEGINKEYGFRESIRVQEKFPAIRGSAFYWLTLKRKTSSYKRIEIIEKELLIALGDLCRVWHFAGGCLMMPIETRSVKIPEYESNAWDVKRHFLKKMGLKDVSISRTIPIDFIGTYRQFPLKNAIRLCHTCDKDLDLLMLFEYYYWALTEPSTWFINLYKIRDVISRICKRVGLTKSDLGIRNGDWRRFGQKLNDEYDLRHVPNANPNGRDISREEIQELKNLGREWIKLYMKHRNIEI